MTFFFENHSSGIKLKCYDFVQFFIHVFKVMKPLHIFPRSTPNPKLQLMTRISPIRYGVSVKLLVHYPSTSC